MSTGSLTLAVFIDAFGWEVLQRHAFLEGALAHQSPLDTIFGYSSSCDPTILTGTLPREHDHFSFFYYDPSRSPFRGFDRLSALPAAIVEHGRVRHWISRVVGQWKRFTGYFQLYAVPFKWLPLFDYSEQRDLYQPGGIRGGQPTVFDHLRHAGVPFHCSDWRASEEENLASLRTAVQTGEIRFAYLFLAHMDAVLHQHGTTATAVADKVQWYDRHLRDLLARARAQYDDVKLMVFSDHGMTNVTDHCNLMARIEALGLAFGRDYAAVYDSTMARFWFFHDQARARIVEALGAEARGHIVTDAELERWGCDFPGRTYGELYFLMTPGVLLHPSFMGRSAPAGMHGFAPEDRDSLAMFASTWTPAQIPRRLDDLCTLMLDSVGVSADALIAQRGKQAA